MIFFQTEKYIHALTIQASIMDRRVVFNRSFGEAGRRRIVFTKLHAWVVLHA
jgi:hypothetical protein